MSKIGEGKNPAREPGDRAYHKMLEQHCLRFLSTLGDYAKESPENRERLVVVMDQHLQLIFAAVPEIKRSGISKEAVLVERAYKAYIQESTLETYAALEHAVMTLREYNC
jgi:hypothetical protein